jgi:hypothetical protein
VTLWGGVSLIGTSATVLTADTDATKPDANGVLNNPPRTVTLRDRQGDPVATLTSWSQLQAVAINVTE